MDVAHGPSPAHSIGAGISAGATSPPSRPAIPPKPDKEKIGGSKANAGTQANIRRFSAADASGVQCARSAFVPTGTGIPPNFRSPVASNVTDTGQTTSPPTNSRSSHPVSPPAPGSNETSPGTRNKPALPPKPVTANVLNSPPTTKFPLKQPPKFPPFPVPPDNNNANSTNNNNCAPGPTTHFLPTSSASNGEQNGILHSPPPSFLRAKPPQSPGDPLLSPRIIPRSPSSRPNSSTFFNFSSPTQNLNSGNQFPSASTGLNQTGPGITSPQRLAQIRVKSASLGRNITFPITTSSSSSGGGIGGFFNRRSSTLSKFLPLDLHIGSARPPPPAPNNKPKPNSLNLNPFIIQQQQLKQQAQMSSQQVEGHPILNFGSKITFSPDSPLPPPPPPRLRRKLSPVNSVGSPTSPTSPSPFHTSLSPGSPLPPPPPVSPGVVGMESVAEAAEERDGLAIYAAVDKQKKWAERRLKLEQRSSPASSMPPSAPPQLQTSLEQGQSATVKSLSSHNNNKKLDILCVSKEVDTSATGNGTNSFKNDTRDSNGIPTESWGVDSWLGRSRYLQRSVSPSQYQSGKPGPGHLYETIGDALGDDGNNNNNAAPTKLVDGKSEVDALEIQETSEVLEDNLCENQSFLFKLVISPKKVDAEGSQPETSTGREDDDAQNLKKGGIDEKCVSGNKGETTVTVQNVQSSVTDSSTEQPIMTVSSTQQETENEEVYHDAVSSYMIPTVIPDLSETSPQTEPNGNGSVVSATESAQIGGPPQMTTLDDNEPPRAEDGSFTSHTSSVTTESTVESNPSRQNSILRRRSWTCDRVASPTLSDSSSTTSSIANNFPYHRRERSYTSTIDEDELSNGALADAESSDVPLRSSAEDIILLKGAPSPKSAAAKSFASRRSRLVNSLFGSFGKGSSSSSGGGGRKPVVMRQSNANKRKEKSLSHFFTTDPLKNYDGAKLGRQISDSILPTTTMISGPILPSSASFSGTEGGAAAAAAALVHKPQSVQFSSEVAETRIIYPEQYSSEEATSANPHSGTLPILSIVEGDRRDDNESVSSSESASGCGSVSGSGSGYEDILSELSPKEKKSFYVAREILTSERTFVDVLNLITVDFPKYLKNASRFHGAQILSNDELNLVLGGLQNLKRVNEDLLADLEDRVAHWRDSPKIADILVKKGPFLKLYATYIKDFQKNSMHLDTCCHKYPLFSAIIKDFEQSERCQKLGLKHYMLKPVQRMPQYRLLLEDYLKSLDKSSEDYDDTVKGIAIVKDVAEHANEAIRLQVNAEKLLHLQNRLTAGAIILKADRQLIKEGELKKVCRKVLQPRFFALMNDCLLCLNYHAPAGSPKDLKLRYELPLAGMRVSLSAAEDYQNEFSVISVTRSFNLVASTPREREEWMKALNNAIHDNIKKRTCSTPDQERGFQIGKEAPVWVQDSRVTMCQQCTAEFTVTFRRHHCRACGKVVCGNCSGNQAPLQYLKNESARVCDSCYEHLLEEFDQHNSFSSNDSDRHRVSLREKFRKVTPNVSKRASKIKRTPVRLEVPANSSGCGMSGYLQWREREKKSWKRRWFVLIDRVLYIYAASEDIVAIKSIPLLGWQVEMDKSEPQVGEENLSVFRLTHSGQQPILFQTEHIATAQKWVAAMSEAVVL